MPWQELAAAETKGPHGTDVGLWLARLATKMGMDSSPYGELGIAQRQAENTECLTSTRGTHAGDRWCICKDWWEVNYKQKHDKIINLLYGRALTKESTHAAIVQDQHSHLDAAHINTKNIKFYFWSDSFVSILMGNYCNICTNFFYFACFRKLIKIAYVRYVLFYTSMTIRRNPSVNTVY